jgi:hypothetical protein
LTTVVDQFHLTNDALESTGEYATASRVVARTSQRPAARPRQLARRGALGARRGAAESAVTPTLATERSGSYRGNGKMPETCEDSDKELDRAFEEV